MASGHVNRIYRPNTWQHRPSLRREKSPCQSGAVHTWHEADMPTASRNVRFRGQSGKHVLTLSFSGFDPNRTSAYSITSSARSMIAVGTITPIAFAVLRLMTTSNLVGRSIGRSPGRAPSIILRTYSAARSRRCR